MTEQQANALMLWISDLTRVYGNEGPELEALTALCWHRDRVVYERVARELWDTDEHNVLSYVYEMQTWEDL